MRIVIAFHDQDSVVGVAPEASHGYQILRSWKVDIRDDLQFIQVCWDNGAKIINTSFNVDKFGDDMTYETAWISFMLRGLLL